MLYNIMRYLYGSMKLAFIINDLRTIDINQAISRAYNTRPMSPSVRPNVLTNVNDCNPCITICNTCGQLVRNPELERLDNSKIARALENKRYKSLHQSLQGPSRHVKTAFNLKLLFKNTAKAPPLLFVSRTFCSTYGTRELAQTSCFLENYVVALRDSNINKLRPLFVSHTAYRIDTLQMRSFRQTQCRLGVRSSYLS